MDSFLSIFKIIIEGKSSKRFLFASILSFGFSIAVILSTIGLMDGFEQTLRESLKKSNSDFVVTARSGFFLEEEVKKLNKGFLIASVLQTEAFAVGNNRNKGILVKGVRSINFNQATNLNIEFNDGEIVIGKELAKYFDLKVGDFLTVAISTNRKRDQGTALLKKLLISNIIEHGIYEKDMRVIYIEKEKLSNILGYKPNTANRLLVKMPSDQERNFVEQELKNNLGDEFSVVPFWNEYRTLIDAVEVEKNSITSILQIIVIVAVFNVLAFVIFIFEKKSQDFFLLRAMGLSLKQLNKFWIKLMALIWLCSSLVALFMTGLFNFALSDLNLLNIPGEIYVLTKLTLVLDKYDYMLVLFISLLWIMIIGMLLLWRMKQKSLLSGLRQEFR